MADVTALVPRPEGIPGDISDALLMEAVRIYMGGGRVDQLAIALGLPTKDMKLILVTPQWRALQRHVRDEFVDIVSSRVARIEHGLLDHIEDMLENGIEQIDYTSGERYHRKLTPKEAASLWGCVQASNKQIEKMRQAEPNRRTFDASARMRALEGFAQRIDDGERQSA